jgi:hypothetical protein
MLLTLPDVLSADQVADARAKLDGAHWSSGRMGAGHQGARAKHNQQLAQTDPLALELGEMILAVLGSHPRFASFGRLLRVLPPMFDRWLAIEHPDHPAAVKLTGIYHNLLRLWARPEAAAPGPCARPARAGASPRQQSAADRRARQVRRAGPPRGNDARSHELLRRRSEAPRPARSRLCRSHASAREFERPQRAVGRLPVADD